MRVGMLIRTLCFSFDLCVRACNGARALYLDPNMFWGLIGFIRFEFYVMVVKILLYKLVSNPTNQPPTNVTPD
jgi:hypothetical protein